MTSDRQSAQILQKKDKHNYMQSERQTMSAPSYQQTASNYTLEMCNHTPCAQVHELPWVYWQFGNGQEGILSVFLAIYNHAHLTYVGFEHPVCHGLLLNSFIVLLAWLVEHFLIHWYQQCVIIHHAPKLMSHHEPIAR